MERDDNLKGQGNSYTTPFRLNDPRLAGRWWSTDPITKPWESPYAGYGNNPVSFTDPLGLYDTPAGAPENPQHNQEFIDENGNLYTYIEKNYNKVGVIGNWIPTAQIEAEGPTWLQRTGDFLAGSGFGALDWIGSKIVAPLDFLMNWNEPSYRQGLENNFNGAVTIVKAAGGDPIAQTQVATGVKQAAENWWNASDFDKGKPFGGVAMDIAVPWGIGKFGRAGRLGALPRAATVEVVIAEETITVYHKGTLRKGNGVVSGTFSTGTDFESVNALSREGGVIEFNIPKSVFKDWDSRGLIDRFSDLDEATGVYNQEFRFHKAISSQLNQYRKK